ncbi:hypothetical protein WJX73_009896, partial [Symbiochloris irregularis]
AQMFSQAAHCYEELLLHQAHHIPYHVQYADILYTIGGSNGNNFRTARSYYAAAVQLSKGTNVRALYGLCACSAQLSGIKGSVGKDQEELGRKAAELLQKLGSGVTTVGDTACSTRGRAGLDAKSHKEATFFSPVLFFQK